MKLIRKILSILAASWWILQFAAAVAIAHNMNHQNYTIPKIAEIAYTLNPFKYL
jgi:hypothetical protein